MAELHIITGPPAAGKSTYVTEHKQPGDIIIDYDAIANTLAGADISNHDHPAHVRAVANAARQAAFESAIKQDCTVWLIHSKPTVKQLQRYQELGAEIHTIDPGKKVVMNRCKTQRPHGSLIAAATWYDEQPKAGKTTTERGYGWKQQKGRDRLMRTLKDGTPCWWCGQPMYRDKRRNHDGLPLCADHEEAYGARDGKPPTRLLHFTCNSSAQNHTNDKKRPAIAAKPPGSSTAPPDGGSGFIW